MSSFGQGGQLLWQEISINKMFLPNLKYFILSQKCVFYLKKQYFSQPIASSFFLKNLISKLTWTTFRQYREFHWPSGRAFAHLPSYSRSILSKIMVLAGSIAVVTHQQAPAVDAAVAQFKNTHALVTNVAVLSVAVGTSVTQTVAAASSSAFDAVIAFNEETAMLSTELHALAPIVKAGGALHVYIADASEDKKVRVCAVLAFGSCCR